MEVGNEYGRDGSAARLMRVVDDSNGLKRAPLSLPLAGDKRVRQLCEALLRITVDRKT
jgi:hypothetical protein